MTTSGRILVRKDAQVKPEQVNFHKPKSQPWTDFLERGIWDAVRTVAIADCAWLDRWKTSHSRSVRNTKVPPPNGKRDMKHAAER